MAKIGAIPGNGVNRAAFSKEDIEARKLLISWARARNFTVAMDAIGNLFIRRAGTDPHAAPVMAGSHMDSQPRGGRFDGIYGVLAGLEALEAIEEAGTRQPATRSSSSRGATRKAGALRRARWARPCTPGAKRSTIFSR